jgi:hypothetical protein
LPGYFENLCNSEREACAYPRRNYFGGVFQENNMSATKRMWGIVFVVAASALLASCIFAAEAPGADVVKLQGVVSVSRDANDVITSVQLTAGDVKYEVVLDAKGKELGEQMDGEKVEAEGTVAEKDGQKMLTVSAFKRIEQ